MKSLSMPKCWTEFVERLYYRPNKILKLGIPNKILKIGILTFIACRQLHIVRILVVPWKDYKNDRRATAQKKTSRAARIQALIYPTQHAEYLNLRDIVALERTKLLWQLLLYELKSWHHQLMIFLKRPQSRERCFYGLLS